MVSVDPGVNGSGVAEWDDQTGELLDAWYGPPNIRCDKLVIEFPQAYAQRRSQKGDQNDLLKLAFTVGGIVALAAADYKLVLPREWKGQVPKDVMVKRIQKKLTPQELACVYLPSAKSLHHNVWDAIGIGLHHLGRL